MLRRSASWVLLVVTVTGAHGQSIQNGGFEALIDCPPSFGPDLSIQLTMADWLTVQGTPDGYHVTCPAIHPSATPDIPAVQFGEGFGALWGPSEVMGQAFDPPLSTERHYCVNLSGIAVELMNYQFDEGDPCLRFCVYGSTIQPAFPDPWSVPVPVENMPGTTLLGCSAPLSMAAWADRTVSFTPPVELPYLFFTSAQDSGCMNVSPYLCVDSLELIECSAVESIAEIPSVPILSSNLVHDHLQIALEVPARLTLRDLQGRTVFTARTDARRTSIALPTIAPGPYVLLASDATGRVIAAQRVIVE
jgi:hypothetical protein